MDAAPQPARRVKRGWMNLKVARVITETHDTKTFVLVDADEGGRPFDYVAGQYLTFRFDHIAEKPLVRSYTMSSSPNQAEFSAFTVKKVDGGLISNWLCDHVKEGDVLRARGPIGRFCFEPGKDYEHLFMIAGGSGVTPFISILREYAAHLGKPGAPQKLSLLVSHRAIADVLLHADMEEARRLGANVIVTLTREDAREKGYWQGRIDEALLARALIDSYQRTTFMLCGPEAMMATAINHLKAMGVAPEHIKTESFAS